MVKMAKSGMSGWGRDSGNESKWVNTRLALDFRSILAKFRPFLAILAHFEYFWAKSSKKGFASDRWRRVFTFVKSARFFRAVGGFFSKMLKMAKMAKIVKFGDFPN